MIKLIKETLSTQSGQLSTMRMLAAFVIVDVMSVWTYTCIAQSQFINMGVDMVGLIIGVLFAKAYQHKDEVKTSE